MEIEKYFYVFQLIPIDFNFRELQNIYRNIVGSMMIKSELNQVI